MRHRLPALLLATLALTAVATPALAHTTANPSTTAAGAFSIVDMRVPHGCDGASTVTLDVSIPAGVVSVKPQMVPGWTATTEIGAYAEPVELHGEELTEGVVAVRWTADDGVELPDAQYLDFGLSVKLPELPGEILYFPAVQTCADGSDAAWIELPTGAADEALEKPAPSIVLTEAATDGHHGAADGDDEMGDDEMGDDETMDDDAMADDEDDEDDEDDDDGSPLVWVALVAGLLGLGLGGASFIGQRRS